MIKNLLEKKTFQMSPTATRVQPKEFQGKSKNTLSERLKVLKTSNLNFNGKSQGKSKGGASTEKSVHTEILAKIKSAGGKRQKTQDVEALKEYKTNTMRAFSPL